MALLLDPDDEAATNGATHGANFSRPADAVAQPSQGACDRSFWTKKAPGVLRREGLDPEAAWNAFWSKRKAPATVARLVHAAGAPVIWGWNIEAVTEECRGLVDIADQLARGAGPDKFAKGKRRASLEAAVGAWLETARDGDTDVSFALGTLAAAHLLHQLGKQLGPEQGWPLVDLLLATARDAGSWQVDVDAPGASALAQQLAAGELPLTLAYLFPEMAPLAALRRGARDQLATGLAELADERGFVRAAHLDVWRPLLACWIRTRAIAEQNAKFAWDEAAEGKLGRVLRQALRWTEAGTGRPLLTNAQVPAWSADFLAAAVRV
ncbi:MAG TPA: hypothetical protein VEQ85_04955, partial [Lacipirellulaceae bacterium]|nr:hypothetical protein [Lacipirellulaceae bacterium]